MLARGTRFGSYEISSALGAGGMGEVYEATDTTLGRRVAIKTLPGAFGHDPERLVRFEREARTLASLNHPKIAQVYGFERTPEASALVMEHGRGVVEPNRINPRPVSYRPPADRRAEAPRSVEVVRKSATNPQNTFGAAAQPGCPLITRR